MDSQPAPIEMKAEWFIGPDSTWLWAMLQLVVLAASLFLIYRQVRVQSQANMLTALFSLAEKWNCEAMLDARRRTCKCYREDSTESDLSHTDGRVASFFEELGLFLKKGAFTADVIWEFYSFYTEHYWPMLEPKIADYRQAEKDLSWFVNFEELYKAMQNVSKKRGLHGFQRSKDDCVAFAKREIEKASRRSEERANGPPAANPHSEADGSTAARV